MPYKEKKRERRIRDHLRMKNRAISIYGNSKDANHLTVCSCAMCGNPRKWFGRRTLQEERFNQ